MIETRHTSLADRELADAAFGGRPGQWPLPTATTPRQLWLRAVACGGQGRYGSAFDDLAALRDRLIECQRHGRGRARLGPDSGKLGPFTAGFRVAIACACRFSLTTRIRTPFSNKRS